MTEDLVQTERVSLIRSFAAELTAGDGRTVDVRVIPFGETATVADGLGGVARGVPYQEEWMPGCFDGQLKAANRVLLNFEHQPGLAGVIGHGVTLERAADGYRGTFRVHQNDDGDKALAMVNDGVLGGVSVEAFPQKSVRRGGIVQRVKAHLDMVALCRHPAYESAVVLAVRADPILNEESLPIPFDPELATRIAALGIVLPAGLQAHPVDTPPEGGTSETAPAETTFDTSSEVMESWVLRRVSFGSHA